MSDLRRWSPLLLLAAACLDRALLLAEAPCPCVQGFTCCASLDICRPEAECPSVDRASIAELSPGEGPMSGGTRVTIRGTGLEAAERVMIGERDCADLEISSPAIRCTTLPSAPASMRVMIHFTDGTSLAWEGTYRFLRAPLTAVTESAELVPIVQGRGLTAYDADGDGLLDLLFTRASGALTTPLLFLNSGGLRFSPADPQPELPAYTTNGVTAADFDRDGRTDLFVWPRYSAGEDAVLLSSSAHVVEVEDGIAGVNALDFDGDGWLDVLGCRDVVPGPTTRPIFLAKGDGTTLVEVDTGEHALRGDCNASVVGDFDRDGDADLLACGHYLALYENRSGAFTDVSGELGLPAMTPPPGNIGRRQCTSSFFVDFDSDGDLDVALSTELQFVVGQLEGTLLFANQLAERGEARFERVPRIDGDADALVCLDHRQDLPLDVALAGGGRAVVWLDQESDGDLDLFVPLPSTFCASEPWLYLSTFAEGGASFVPHPIPSAGLLGSVAAGLAIDLDGDDDLDVVHHQEGNFGGRSLFRNGAVENGSAGHHLFVHAPPGSTVEVDLDGPDGDPDFALGRGSLQVRTVSGDGFGAQGPPIAHFGFGRRSSAVAVRVSQPSGARRVERDVAIDRTIDLR